MSRLNGQKSICKGIMWCSLFTDTATDGAFENNGILAMTTESFLTKPLSEMFTV